MNKLISIALISLFLINTNSHAAESCADVYVGAVRDVSLSTRQFAEYNYLYTQQCESNGELRSSSAGLDLTATIKIVDFGFSGNKQDAVSKMRDFCKTHNQTASVTENTYNLKDEVVSEALKTFNQCRYLEINGVDITHQVQDPRSVIVAVDFNPSKTTLNLRTVEYDPNDGECRTTGLSNPNFFSDAQPIILSKDLGETKIERPFSIVCTRKYDASEGSEKFGRFSLGIDTNQGTYTLVLPPEEVFGFDLASQNKLRFAKMESHIKEQDNELNTLRSAKADLDARIKNVGVEPHAVVQGRYAVPGWEHSQCPQLGGNLTNYIRGVCGNRNVFGPNRVRSHSGNTCGYNYYVFACLSL